jgi:hypothetical protein
VKERVCLGQAEIGLLHLVEADSVISVEVEIDILLDQEAEAAMAEADSVAIEITLMVKKESASQEKKEIISSWTLSLTEGFRVIYIFP